MGAHLITGATGFVGGALALELLDRGIDRLFCLVRAQTEDEAEERLSASLERAAATYGAEVGRKATRERCVALVGDLVRPHCGLVALSESVDQIWHCAASLDYREDKRQGIRETNVQGTQHVLDLARSVPDVTVNYVSTAYVAGTASGRIAETVGRDETVANNAYERTKIAAEVLVADSGLSFRILRPSIVIGHSRTFGATGFTGAYALIRDLRQLRQEVERRLGNFLSLRAIRAKANPEVELNLIPVDAVARNMAALGLDGPTDAVFHVTNNSAPSVDLVTRVICEELGVRPPEFVQSDADLSSLDKRINDDPRMEFLRTYTGATKEFDQAKTEAVLGGSASAFPLDESTWRSYVRWYLALLEGKESSDAEKYGLWQVNP